MTIIKAAGVPPSISTGLRRDIRAGLRQAGAIVRGQLMADAKAHMVEEATASLAAMGPVAGLNARDYRKAKIHHLRTLRRTERKSP